MISRRALLLPSTQSLYLKRRLISRNLPLRPYCLTLSVCDFISPLSNLSAKLTDLDASLMFPSQLARSLSQRSKSLGLRFLKDSFASSRPPSLSSSTLSHLTRHNTLCASIPLPRVNSGLLLLSLCFHLSFELMKLSWIAFSSFSPYRYIINLSFSRPR
jgi:hypothetical protein